MSSLTPLEKKRFESLFGMASGYVLDFTDRTFTSFFKDILRLNIDDAKYAPEGWSKAKRLRTFWEKEDDQKVGSILREMLGIWLYNQTDKVAAQKDPNYLECQKTISRLCGVQEVQENVEETFLAKNFGKLTLQRLQIEASPTLIPVLEQRLKEIELCMKAEAPLAVVFLSGSVLEGILLGAAVQSPQKFNQSEVSPKKNDKVLPFHEWTLANLIDVAFDIGILKLDVKKFSHALRDFRNYIHPYQQMSSTFSPDMHTAKICVQVLSAAIAELSGERKAA